MEPARKARAKFDGDIAHFFVHRGAHDGLGEDVEQVGAHGQDAFNAGAHQGRGDDKAAAGADAAGDQARGQTDKDGGKKNPRSIKGRGICGFAAR